LLRPPVFFTVTTSDFSGFDAVISSNEGASLCREPAVTGLSFFNAIAQILYVAIKINYFSLGERYDRFLVPRSAARQNTSLCITGFLLTHHVLCIHALHIHSILLLYGSLDLNLIGIHIHDETVFSFLIESGNFLSNQWSLQNTHYCLFNKVSILLNELSTK